MLCGGIKKKTDQFGAHWIVAGTSQIILQREMEVIPYSPSAIAKEDAFQLARILPLCNLEADFRLELERASGLQKVYQLGREGNGSEDPGPLKCQNAELKMKGRLAMALMPQQRVLLLYIIFKPTNICLA